LADENPPIRTDFSDVEAAADALLKKARGAKPAEALAKRTAKVEAATTETRRVRVELEDAEQALKDLEKEYEAARAANKKLTETQRRVLAGFEDKRATGKIRGIGFSRTTSDSLVKRGLIEVGDSHAFEITEKGRGVHDPSLVAGDIEKQVGYIERLREEAARDVQTAVRADKQTAEANATAAKQVKARAQRRPKVPAAPTLTAKQRDLMAEYLAAAQGGEGTSERAQELRKELAAQKVLGANTIGNYGQIPRATTPTLGSQAWQTQFEKAQKSPGFSFTPHPARLAREMARAAGGVDWFPEELSQLATRKTNTDKNDWVSGQQQIIAALRPQAEQRLGELPASARKKIDDAVKGIKAIDASARGSYAEMEAALGNLLNTVEKVQGVGATPARKPKITYASTAVKKEIEAANAAREAAARVEVMRAAGAGQYAKPIGPQLTPEITAASRRASLEAERRKVAKRLTAAENRLAVNEMSTPANQDRTAATYEKHKAHLERIDRAIDETYRQENEAQAKREAGTVRQRIGVTTPAQDAARARRLEREQRVAEFQRVKAMREAGAGQYPEPIGPTDPRPRATVRLTPTMRKELAYHHEVLRDTPEERHLPSARFAPPTKGDWTLPADTMRAIAKELDDGRGQINRDNLAYGAESLSAEDKRTERNRLKAVEEFQRRVEQATRSETEAVEQGEERKTKAVQEGVAKRSRIVTVDIPGLAHNTLLDTYATDTRGNDPEGVRAVQEAKTLKRGRGYTARLTASRKAIADILEDNAARLGAYLSEPSSFPASEIAALKKADENLGAALKADQRQVAEVVEQAAERKRETGRQIVADPNQYKRPIGPANLRPVTVRPKAAAAPTGDIAEKVGDLAAFERKLDGVVDKLAAALDPDQRAEFERRQRQASEAEKVVARERVGAAKENLAAEKEAQAAQRQAQTQAARESRDLIRHPTLAQFPGRDPGPFGRVYASDSDEAGAARGARSPLQSANARLRAAQDAQEQSAKALREANRNRASLSDDELNSAADKHRQNQQLVDDLRRERRAIQRDIEATIESTRARNAETAQLIESARVRGTQGVAAGRQLERYNQPGRALARTGVSRDDPFSQLSAAERARLSGPGRPGTALVRTGASRDDPFSQLLEHERRMLEQMTNAQSQALAQSRQAFVQRSRSGAAEFNQPAPLPGRERFDNLIANRRVRAEAGRPATGPFSPSELSAAQASEKRQSAKNAADQATAQQAVEERARVLAEATRLTNEYTASQAGLGSQLEKTAISADLASQRFRKHGALTTEFIEAAAKGEVTVAELGYQLTATVGKFAGWTAAASAVYGVVGALSQVSEGAMAASSSIGLVSRVVTEDFDAGKLQTGLGQLSEQFNVPIQDAADAVYGAGKSFHDLPGAIEGARAALFAMKVGELDAGASTQSLTAIVNGFRLSAAELMPVMDTVNNVTNKFGGNVGQLVQGVAKAGGQFLSAGGNYRELVAILTTGARLTGSTAEEVATAVGRSASVLRTPAGAARARAAGLDPTLDPLAVLQQAQQLGRGASPERVQELARALVPAGGQFARIFVPLIQNAELLNKVLAETTPEKTKGSAQRELAKVLSQANEQIKALGNGLQRLGAALAQSGLLAPVLGFVKTVNLAINTVTDLLGLFNRVVPDPFKAPLATLLELYGVLRLVRRFDVGGQIAPGSRIEPLRQFISAGPQRTSQRQITQGIAAERRFLLNERERAGQRAAIGSFRERAANERLTNALAGGDVDVIERRTRAFQRASEQASDLVEEEADLRRLINENDKRRVDTLENIRRGMTPEQALGAAGGSYRTAGVDRPTTQGPVRINDAATRGGVILPVPSGDARRAARAMDQAADATHQAAREADQVRGRMARFGDAMGGLGASGRAIAAVTGGAGNATRAAGTGLRAAAVGIGRLAATIGASLGPLDLVILGVLGVMEAVNQFQKEAEQHAERIRTAQRPSSDPEQIRRQVEDLPERAEPRVFSHGTLPADKRDREDAALRDRREAAARTLQAQQQAGRALSTGVIDQRLAAEKAIAATPKEQVAALQKALTSLDEGYAALYGAKDLAAAKKSGDKDAIAAAQAVIDGATAARERIAAGLNALASAGSAVDQALAAAKDFKALQELIGQQAAAFELAGGKGRAGSVLGAASTRAAQLYAAGGFTDTAEYLKTLKDAEQALISAAQTRLERALSIARSPVSRRAARGVYLSTITQDIGVDDVRRRMDEIAEQQQSRERRINVLKLKRQTATPVDPLTGKPKLGGLPGGLTPEEEAKLRALEEDVATATKEERALRLALRHKRALLRDVARELRRAAFEESQSLYEAHTEVGAARQPAGAARIGYQLRRVGAEIRRAIKEYGRNSREVLALIGSQLSLQAAAVDQQLAAIQASGDLAAAKATTPEGEQAARGKSLQDVLDFQKAHPERYDPKVDVVQTQAAIFENAKRKREDVEAKYRELIDARYAYLESLTDDPVKIARLEEQKANKLLARGGLSATERYRAKADANNARRAAAEAALQAKLDDIDFDVEIGKLTTEEQIKKYEELLKTSKVGTQRKKELKREIERLKHQAETADESSFELGLDNIRIPTMYEVARLIKGGPGGVTTAVTNANQVNVYVNGQQDYEQLGRVLEKHVSGAGKATARAAQMR
jgi:TP901 family phage tail tape measure protein